MLGSNPRPVWICLLKNVLKETTGFAQVTAAGGGSPAPNTLEVPFETQQAGIGEMFGRYAEAGGQV